MGFSITKEAIYLIIILLHFVTCIFTVNTHKSEDQDIHTAFIKGSTVINRKSFRRTQPGQKIKESFSQGHNRVKTVIDLSFGLPQRQQLPLNTKDNIKLKIP